VIYGIPSSLLLILALCGIQVSLTLLLWLLYNLVVMIILVIVIAIYVVKMHKLLKVLPKSPLAKIVKQKNFFLGGISASFFFYFFALATYAFVNSNPWPRLALIFVMRFLELLICICLIFFCEQYLLAGTKAIRELFSRKNSSLDTSNANEPATL